MSNTIAQMVLTDPPALSPVTTGAETKAQAYTLTAPTLASSPLTIKHPDGTAFDWKPTELVYRDAAGQMDYLVGSSPSSLTTRGCEARYTRIFPTADDVFCATANGVKHWTVLHEPPRTPAAYLGEGIEFGVSGLITGVPLPLGSHKEIATDRFNFPEPIAKDLNGEVMTGRYEVVNSAEGQQLFIWFPASYLETATYPVMIDPTVIVSAAYSTVGNGGRKIVRLTNGWLVSAAWDSSVFRTYYYKSTDNGTTWTQLCWNVTVQEGVSLASVGTTVLAVMNNLDGVGIAYIKFDATTVSNAEVTKNNVYYDGTTGRTDDYLSSVVDGSGVYHVAFSAFTSSYPNSKNIFYTKSTDGGTTWAAVTQLTTDNAGGVQNKYPSIAIRSNGQPVISYAMLASGLDDFIVCAAYNGSTWSGVTVYQPITVEGYTSTLVKKNGSNIGRIIVAFEYSGTVRVRYSDDNGATWFAFSGDAVTGVKPTVSENAAGEVFVFYANSNISYLPLPNGSTTFNALVVLSATGSNPSVMEREVSTVIGIVFMDGSTVKFDELSYNNAPFAPTGLTRSNYDATAVGSYSWVFSDPDAFNTQSAYQLLIKRVSDGVTIVDTGKVASTTSSHTLAAATLANNVQYQWQVRTWDNKDLVGPYSSLSTFWTSAKPTASITVPATDGATVSSSSLTASWSFSDPESQGQSAYQVKLTDSADAVLWDSGKVADVNARSRTIVYTLANSTSYKTKVTVWDAKDIASVEAVRTFTTSFTVPATPTITVTAQSGCLSIGVTNPVPSGGQPSVSTNDIYRRKLGDTAWTRIVANIPANTPYNDYAAASGVTYEYKVTAKGSNGTTVDSAVVIGSLTLNGVWLHSTDDPQGTAHNYKWDGNGRGSDWKPEVAMMQFAGRSNLVAEFGELEDGKVSVQLEMYDGDLDFQKLDTLVRRKGTVCYRDGRGRKLFGIIPGLPMKDEHWGYTTTVEVIETAYSETI
ncbi:MAG: hypothetical protein ACQEXQ_16325 [Bacillota bacterium]